MNPIKVGKFIAMNRKKLNMTQEDLGNKINVSRKTISRWETGKYMPDISLLLPISEILQISVHELLLGEYIEDKDMKKKSKETTQTIVTMSKKKHRRIDSCYIIVILLLLLFGVYTYYNDGFALHGNVEHVKHIVETSKLYTEEEIYDAMDVIINDFKRSFHGCILKELRYSDEECLDSSIVWANEYDVNKAIVIYSTFDVSDNASNTFNKGSTYTMYYFVLVENNGTWIIRNNGMG